MHTTKDELVQGFGVEFPSKKLLFSNAEAASSHRRFPWTVWKSDFFPFKRLDCMAILQNGGDLSLSIYKTLNGQNSTPRPPIWKTTRKHCRCNSGGS
jgi:hypothetical protein